MIRNIIIGFIILGIFTGIVHADVGPSPPSPDITVYLVNGSMPETTITQIVYHCMGIEKDVGTGSVDPQLATLPCNDGTCTNTGGWYYKFNPCFSFPAGYFSYEYKGTQMRTQTFVPEENKDSYSYTIDVEKGEIIGQTSSKKDFGCWTSAILIGLLGLAATRR